MAKNKILKATTNSEIISYFINQNPEIASELDLPVQGESTEKYGKLIMDNVRYKNMFINTVNLIGLTVIKENRWENPWDNFTTKGTLRFGEQIREVADYAILIGEKKTKPIKEGLLTKGFDKDKIVVFNDVREAYPFIEKLATDKDKDVYALFENDLPDTYNEK